MKTIKELNEALRAYGCTLDSFAGSNPKLEKSAVPTFGNSLDPSIDGRICPHKGLCGDLCLKGSGMQFASKYASRAAKTRLLYKNRHLFMLAVVVAIARKQRKHGRINYRANVISDVPYWHSSFRFMPTMEETTLLEKLGLDLLPSGSYSIFEIFPDVVFYDYTKTFATLIESIDIANFHITFSLDGQKNISEALTALKHGFNVAVPALIERPEFFTIAGQKFRTYDADASDDRTLDPKPGIGGLGSIGWLKYKRVVGNPANNGFLMETDHIQSATIARVK